MCVVCGVRHVGNVGYAWAVCRVRVICEVCGAYVVCGVWNVGIDGVMSMAWNGYGVSNGCDVCV